MTQKLSFPKDRIKIVLFEGIHPYAVEVFNKNGYTNVERLEGASTEEQLYEKIKDAHMVGIRSRTQLTDGVLDHAKKLMAIGCFCIGTNQVDLGASAIRGIPVFNAPHSNTRSVAELVIGQAIMLMRGIFPKSAAAHRGEWQKSASGSNEIRGKVMGIVGYGHIGTQVSILAEAMGMQVVFHDIQSRLVLGNATSLGSLDELLEQSDVVTLHVPDDAGTRNLFNRDAIYKMKKGSYLINASRGSVVDLEALAERLRAGDIAGAAVDVFPVEPKSNKHAFESPLLGLEQVILTPHIGGSTQEAQQNIGREVASKLVFFSDRGTTEGAVNFPAVNLVENGNAQRILHIHRNTPGMLRQINKILAQQDINVVGQYLGTTQEIGYVVLDIEDATSDELLDRLKQIEGTIRARRLY